MAAVTMRARRQNSAGHHVGATPRHAWFRGRGGGLPTTHERVLWLRQLALLLRAGVPLLTALDKARPARRGRGATAWTEVQAAVESGSGLAEAMERHAGLFDRFTVRMIACGELSGTLDAALERIAVQCERSEAVRRTLRRAMVYPSAVALVAAAAMAILLIFVVPVFAEVFEGQGEALPWPTRVVLECSRLSVVGLPLAALAIVVGAVSSWRLLQLPVWRGRWDAALLQLPLLGPVVRAMATSRAAESLASLLAGGLPLLEALSVAAETAGNESVSDSLRTARQALSNGRSLSAALQHDSVWPDLALQLIAVGEATGGLDSMLTRVAEFLREDGEQRVNLLLALLEPAIVVSLAIVIGGLVVAMYLPVFRLGALL